MSTPQTDAHWETQKEIADGFEHISTILKRHALYDALVKIDSHPEIDARTKERCRAIYEARYDDEPVDEYREEREATYREQQAAPGEGFNPTL